MIADAPTRRAMLGLFAAAPIAATACVAGTPAHAAVTTFDAKLAAFRRADAIYKTVLDEYLDAEERFEEECPVRPPSIIRKGDTERTYNARVAAEKAAHEAAEQAAKDRHGVDRHYKRQHAALNAMAAALDTLLAEPAPNLAAAATKLEVIIASDGFRDIDDIGPLLADLRRLGSH